MNQCNAYSQRSKTTQARNQAVKKIALKKKKKNQNAKT